VGLWGGCLVGLCPYGGFMVSLQWVCCGFLVGLRWILYGFFLWVYGEFFYGFSIL
jgi:hypothetical protein